MSARVDLHCKLQHSMGLKIYSYHEYGAIMQQYPENKITERNIFQRLRGLVSERRFTYDMLQKDSESSDVK